jgi:hypothetical protein
MPTPLTDLEQQVQDLLQPHFEQITIEQEPLNTITPARLQEVLLEKDIDDILCLKGDYSSDTSIEAKVDKVYDILNKIFNSDAQLSAIDNFIKQLQGI